MGEATQTATQIWMRLYNINGHTWLGNNRSTWLSHRSICGWTVKVTLAGNYPITYKLPHTSKCGCIGWVASYLQGVTRATVGMCNFLLSPQSQFRSLKEALLQSQFRNFLRNVAPQPQLRSSAIRIFFLSPQLQVSYLRTSFPQLSAYFRPWNPVDS
jgi:hypothetical protein